MGLKTLVLLSWFASTGSLVARDYRGTGSVRMSQPDGSVAVQRAEFRIPDKWIGNISLSSDSKVITSTMHDHRNLDGHRFLSTVFRDLPHEDANAVLILSSEYRDGGVFSGQIFLRTFTSAKEADHALEAFFEDRAGFQAQGSFIFSETPLVSARRDIRTRKTYFSKGGAGRHWEAYVDGPIQNPGPHERVARFEQGIPDGYTRAAQFEAQRIGIQRANSIARSIRPYGFTGWFIGLGGRW